jgi:hypothetical protein
MRIWKFPFQVADIVTISMPIGADILSVQVQRDMPAIWAKVDPQAPVEGRQFRCFGTGQPLPDMASWSFLGTVQLFDGELVFHVFGDATQ